MRIAKTKNYFLDPNGNLYDPETPTWLRVWDTITIIDRSSFIPIIVEVCTYI